MRNSHSLLICYSNSDQASNESAYSFALVSAVLAAPYASYVLLPIKLVISALATVVTLAMWLVESVENL